MYTQQKVVCHHFLSQQLVRKLLCRALLADNKPIIMYSRSHILNVLSSHITQNPYIQILSLFSLNSEFIRAPVINNGHIKAYKTISDIVLLLEFGLGLI